MSCADFIPNCKQCNDDEPEIECEVCAHGFIPGVMGENCVPLIPNCLDDSDDYMIIGRHFHC